MSIHIGDSSLRCPYIQRIPFRFYQLFLFGIIFDKRSILNSSFLEKQISVWVRWGKIPPACSCTDVGKIFKLVDALMTSLSSSSMPSGNCLDIAAIIMWKNESKIYTYSSVVMPDLAREATTVAGSKMKSFATYNQTIRITTVVVIQAWWGRTNTISLWDAGFLEALWYMHLFNSFFAFD